MKRITITYSMYHKKKYDRSGTLLEGKYKNVLINSDPQLLQVSRYIHRNPEELQGSVPCFQYPYSSYKYYLGLQPTPQWLKTHHLMHYFDYKSQRYKSFVEMKPYDDNVTDKHIV